MSLSSHRADAVARVGCFVLTVSDTRTVETDASGAAIARLLTANGHLVTGRDIVKDDGPAVKSAITRQLAERDVQAIITTGGTGLAKRDTTCEAVDAIFDKRIDGFGELFRVLSFHDVGAAALLSRACAGIAAGRVLFVLPGSEAAVTLAMEKLILPELGHIVRELQK